MRKSMLLAVSLSAGLAILLPASHSHAELRLPAVISDHMVLQQETENAIWGWDSPGATVTVRCPVGTVSTTADKTGRWQVLLPPLKPGEPFSLAISGSSSRRVQDVLVGEVWLASGQSNMAMPVRGAKNAEQEQAAANFPQIRMFQTTRMSIDTPQDDCRGQWLVCTPQTVGGFSATAYYFGRELHERLNCPVGLLHSSWGGTAVEAWTSLEAQAALPKLAPVLKTWEEQIAAHDPDAARADYERQLAKWKEASARNKIAGKPAPRRPTAPSDPRLNQNRPGNLFNGMIAPLVPYGIRGAIWYQGERNRRGPSQLYGDQLQCLIADWRGRWERDAFPFLYVQLPNFTAPQTMPVEEDGWVDVRVGMDRTLSVPHTGMAVTIDVGEANDIHPKNKQDVGKRLALWALGTTYNKEIVYSGPRVKSHAFTGADAKIQFDHVGGGLECRSETGKLDGFAMAGADGVFHWAEAKIVGDSVEVSSAAVAEPREVRYAWAPHPKCSLYNRAGLPAAPFQIAP
ncbi:MAG: sialate O-acetylesterase [Planctomycetales bacterium]|nr:sialate O-acetylesterase [Planctomycetales bacterium]